MSSTTEKNLQGGENREDGINQIARSERLIPRVVDELAMNNPEQIFGIQAKSIDIDQGLVTIMMKDLAHGADYVYLLIDQHLGHNHSPSTIAYIGPADFRYYFFQVGAIKRGDRLFMFSLLNSQSVNVDLLKQTGCHCLFYDESEVQQAQDLAREIIGLKTAQVSSVEKILQNPVEHHHYTNTWEEVENNVAVIIHTTGTTGSPKPIRYTNAFLGFIDSWGRLPAPGGRVSKTIPRDPIRAYLGISILHSGGVVAGAGSIFTGRILVLGPAEAPIDAAIVPNLIEKADLNMIAMNPSMYETLYRNYPKEFIRASKNLKLVWWLGGPLKQAVGEWMRDNIAGELAAAYGTTESAMLRTVPPPREYWDAFIFHPYTGISLEPVDSKDPNTLYEAVIVKQPETSFLQGIFYIFPDLREWRTRDLFRKHEHLPGAWTYNGRRDDVIVLSTAYKVNAPALEHIVEAHPGVASALVFGNERPACGILIEPNSTDAGNEIIDEVWQLIRESDATLSEPYQVERDMIILANPEKPFVKSSMKGTLIRPATEKLYEKEIEHLY